MAVGKDGRRAERRRAVTRSFPPEHVEAALDVLDLMDRAWHEAHGEPSPPGLTVDDVLLVAGGDLARLADAARAAVEDWRDVRLWGDEVRRERRESRRERRAAWRRSWWDRVRRRGAR